MDKIKEAFEFKQPVVPTSWEIIPFKKAVSIISDKGKRIKQKEYLQSGAFPVIDQGQDYIGGYTNDKNLVFDGKLPIIVFGDHTRVIKYVYEPFAVGADGIKILRPENCYSFKFFYYLLTSLLIPSRGYSRHFQFLRNFYFPLAPLPEQHRIVAEIEKQFSRLDEAVAGLKRIQANLKRYRASVLKSAVEGKLTAEWRKQHPDTEPAEQLLQRILKERRAHWEQAELEKMQAAGKPPKDDQWKQKYKEPVMPDVSELPALPDGWVWGKLQLLTLGVEYGTSAKSKEKGNCPVLRMGNIQNYKFDWSNLVYSVDKEEIEKYLLKVNDVLFNRTNSPELVGKTAIYCGERPAIFAGYLIRVNQIQEIVEAKLLNYFLNSNIAKQYGNTVKTDGVNQSNINGTKLVNYPFRNYSDPLTKGSPGTENPARL